MPAPIFSICYTRFIGQQRENKGQFSLECIHSKAVLDLNFTECRWQRSKKAACSENTKAQACVKTQI